MDDNAINPNFPGLDTSLSSGQRVAVRNSRFAFDLPPGATIAQLIDPFGSGSTYETIGTVPGQLALSGDKIVRGNSIAITGASYTIIIVVTSPDGVRQAPVRIAFRAALPLGGTPSVTPTPVPTPSPGPSVMTFAAPGDHSNVDLTNSTITAADAAAPTVNLRIKGVVVDGDDASATWWSPFVEIKGCLGKRPTISLLNTGYWTSYRSTQKLLWSHDRITWQAFDNQNTSTSTRTVSNNTEFAQDTVYVSWLPSIAVGDRPAFYAGIAALRPARFRLLPNSANGAALMIPGGRVGAAGQAIPSLPVLGAQIEDFGSALPKRTMLVMMAQHPSEDHAERQALAFLRTIIVDDYLMARWRILVYWMNPAGQYGGSRRTTFEGNGTDGGNPALANRNSNRGWTDTPALLADTRAFQAKVLADVAALGKSKIQASFDFHGAPSVDRSFTYAGLTITPREQRFIDMWTAVRPGFYAEVDAATAGAAYDWAKKTLSPDFSLSTEVGGGWGATSETSYDQYGVELVDVMRTATQASVFPLPQGTGVFRPSHSGQRGVFALQSPSSISAARGAWSY